MTAHERAFVKQREQRAVERPPTHPGARQVERAEVREPREALHDLERVRREVQLLEARAAVEALDPGQEAPVDDQGAEVREGGEARDLRRRRAREAREARVRFVLRSPSCELLSQTALLSGICPPMISNAIIHSSNARIGPVHERRLAARVSHCFVYTFEQLRLCCVHGRVWVSTRRGWKQVIIAPAGGTAAGGQRRTAPSRWPPAAPGRPAARRGDPTRRRPPWRAIRGAFSRSERRRERLRVSSAQLGFGLAATLWGWRPRWREISVS